MVTTPVVAETLVKTLKDNKKQLLLNVEVDYAMGENDSRMVARDIALQKAKQMAAERAGSYVASHKTIHNDSIQKDSLEVMSYALIKSTIKSEKISILPSGQANLNLVIEASLDKQLMARKLQELEEQQRNLAQPALIEAKQPVVSSTRKQTVKANKSDYYSDRKVEANKVRYHVGESIMACGKFVQYKFFNKGIYLNIDKPFPNQNVTFVVWENVIPSLEEKFGKLTALTNKRLCALGIVETYKDRHQIQVNNANNLRLMH